jgi:hypothetical protein
MIMQIKLSQLKHIVSNVLNENVLPLRDDLPKSLVAVIKAANSFATVHSSRSKNLTKDVMTNEVDVAERFVKNVKSALKFNTDLKTVVEDALEMFFANDIADALETFDLAKQDVMNAPEVPDLEPEVDEAEVGLAKMGKFAMPRLRNDLPKSVLNVDPNTDFENEVEHELSLHTSTVNKPISDKTINYVKQAIEKGWYPKVFREPEVEEVFRGLSLRPEIFSELVSMESVKPGATVRVSQKVKVARFKELASSWSKSRAMAASFARGKKENVSVILVAKPKDNPGLFWDFSSATTFDLESEVIALEPIVTISALCVLDDEMLDPYDDD